MQAICHQQHFLGNVHLDAFRRVLKHVPSVKVKYILGPLPSASVLTVFVVNTTCHYSANSFIMCLYNRESAYCYLKPKLSLAAF